MEGLRTLRERIVDSPESLGERKRARRWELLIQAFPEVESMSVIDLGGTAEAWLRAPVRPASLHIVNLEAPSETAPSWIRADQADVCDLPAHLSGARYDLVYSNSVIEHLGGYAQRMLFAGTVHRLADRHWVQTPYRYFPIEPHWLFPGFQFLPLNVRAHLSQRWPLVHTPSQTREEAVAAVIGVELLSRAEMTFYFPDSELRAERMLGAVKSLIAIKSL